VSLGKSKTATLIRGDFSAASLGLFIPDSSKVSERASNRRAKRESEGNGLAIAFVAVFILYLCLDFLFPLAF